MARDQDFLLYQLYLIYRAFVHRVPALSPSLPQVVPDTHTDHGINTTP